MPSMVSKPQLNRILARVPAAGRRCLLGHHGRRGASSPATTCAIRCRGGGYGSGTVSERAEQRVSHWSPRRRRRPSLARRGRPDHPGLHPHQAPDRQALPDGGAGGPPRLPAALEPLAEPAAAGAGGVQGRKVPGSGGDRHRRPGHRRGGDWPRGELRPPPRSRGRRAPHRLSPGPRRAARPPALAGRKRRAFCATSRS